MQPACRKVLRQPKPLTSAWCRSHVADASCCCVKVKVVCVVHTSREVLDALSNVCANGNAREHAFHSGDAPPCPRFALWTSQGIPTRTGRHLSSGSAHMKRYNLGAQGYLRTGMFALCAARTAQDTNHKNMHPVSR